MNLFFYYKENNFFICVSCLLSKKNVYLYQNIFYTCGVLVLSKRKRSDEMRENGYFLGIDGGGTKTTALCVAHTGAVVAKISGESINFCSEGMERARENLRLIVRRLSETAGVSNYRSVFIGSSALSKRADTETLERFAGGIIKTQTLIMDSDLAAALATMQGERECAAVISGTGSMAVLKTASGALKTAGGWGYILGDEGSAYAIALDGIRAGIRGFEGSGERTLLTDELLSFFGASDIYDLVGMFYDPPMERKRIAGFARRVCACSRADIVAKEIIFSQAELLSRTVLALLRGRSTDIKIGVWGGVLLNCEAFRAHLADCLAAEGYKNVSPLPFAPEVGAVFEAVRAAGEALDEGFIKNISEGAEKSYDFS